MKIKSIKKEKPEIYIGTWQSLVKQDPEWFEQFQVVIGDEAHTFAAKSLIRIMESLVNCEYRFGFTGTISSKSKVNKLVLEGLFGPLKQVIKTKDLMDDGTVAKLNIKCLILNYTKEDKKDFRTNHTLDKDGNPLPGNKRYQAELSYIQEHEGRNKFIRNLIWSMKDQNNLILFERVEHGRTIKNLLEREDRILHFVHGDVSADVREQLRHDIENDPKKRHDVVASFGTFSTGISIKRLDNLFFVASSKSEIRVLQSIGRLLRKGNGSDDTTLYDLTDVLSNNKSKPNYMMKQFQERVEIYSKEKFNFKIFTIDM